MSRVRLVRELAEATGSSLTDASRFVKQVGDDTARRALRGAETRTSWRLPALAGIGTGGALTWRQQDVWEAQAIAEESRNSMEALKLILESEELSPEAKERLAGDLGTGGIGDDDNGGLGFGDLLGGDLQRTILMIVALLIVISFAVNYASNIGMSAAQGGVR